MTVKRKTRPDPKTGKDVTYFQIHVCDRDPNGKVVEVRRQLSNATIREAENMEHAVRCAIRNGTYGKKEEVKPKIPTFKEFKKTFLDNYARVHNKTSTVDSKEGEIRRYLEPAFGRLPLDAIRVPEIDALKADLSARKLSPKTINNALGTLRKMLNYAEESEVISRVPRIRPLPVPECKTDHLTPSELKNLLLAATFNMEWHDMILFAARTGVRYSELCELRWSDVNLETRTIHVSRGYVRKEVTDRKNHKSVEIPLSPDAFAMLKAKRQVVQLHGDPLVFCQPNGKRHIHRRADVALKLCCEKAKIRPIGWHKLRHTFASQITNTGGTLLVVKELCGHEDIKSTMRYAHVEMETKRRAVAMLDEQDTDTKPETGGADEAPAVVSQQHGSKLRESRACETA